MGVQDDRGRPKENGVESDESATLEEKEVEDEDQRDESAPEDDKYNPDD